MSKIFTVTMPDIGEGVVEGEVLEWLKKVGDSLGQDEPVVVVMTDKATVELPSPYPGKLVKLHYQPGQIAVKDKPLYDIELASEVAAKPVVQETKRQVSQASTPVSQASQPISTEHHTQAAPTTRQVAKKLGVDINLVAGTGKGGRVTAQDIKNFTASTQSLTVIERLPGDEESPLIGIRHLMAERMAESNTNIPHFSYFEAAEATRLIQLRQSFKEKASEEGIHVTYMPFLIRALSMTIKRFPVLNSSLDMAQNKLILRKQHNVGIAAATEHGLIVPVLKNIQEMSMQELIRSYDQLKKKIEAGKLHPSDMKEGTITISNFGVLGGEGLWATPIIIYPEVAILAAAKIHKQPIVKNGEVVARDILNLSWSFDHRVIDGKLAASISHHFTTLIQNPAQLI